MYKDPHYHRRFVHLLYLTALTPLFLYLFYNYFVTPELTIIDQSLGAHTPQNSYTLLIIISFLSLFQIPLGFVLDRKIKTGPFPKSYLIITIIILISNFILTSFALGQALTGLLQPIYNLTDYMR